MFRAANRAAVRLWKDESGVVLAVTVIVFLALFMMASAVFTIGESIRLRVELQNAADSAAYSAAIVQADCNSRVAAINRAMSWHYVQMVRKEMDYIVDKWLERILLVWKINDKAMMLFNAGSACNRGVPYYVTGYSVSVGNGANHKKVRLNKKMPLVSIEEIEQARKNAQMGRYDYKSLLEPIEEHKRTIRAMNQKEQELISKLPGRIKKTVEGVLKANVADTWNDGFAGGAKLSYVLKQEENPFKKTFEIMKQKVEDDFLRHSNYIPEEGNSADKVFGPGSENDKWFVATGQQEGIRRGYKQRSNCLIAEWHYASSAWVPTKTGCRQVASFPRTLSTVRGQDVWDSRFTSEIAKANILLKKYFSKEGSLVVGLTRRLNNPLQFLVAGGDLGIIRPFTLDSGNRYMWTVAAARAGYNPPKGGQTQPDADAGGKYEETWIDKSGKNDLWNLKSSDWDATLLPLHRAWAQGENHTWNGATAGQILNDVKGGAWTPLYGGGGTVGTQRAPKLMGAGSDLNYQAAEGWAVH
jgi:Na+-transporting methylmalonyl-CoA/oxaloacetate decarboxylase gamma subunit